MCKIILCEQIDMKFSMNIDVALHNVIAMHMCMLCMHYYNEIAAYVLLNYFIVK